MENFNNFFSKKQLTIINPNEKDAYDLLVKGEEKLKSKIIEKILNNRKENLEEAIELFEKAGFIFKNLLCWKEASEAFDKCALIELELSSIQEAAEFYIHSGQCLFYIDKEKFDIQINKAVNCYLSYKQYSQAGGLLYELAEYYMKIEKYDQASYLYKQSSNVLNEENISSKGLAYFSLIKFADMQILMNNHKSVVNYDIINQLLDIYNTISNFYMTNRILKPKAKEVYRKIIILSLISKESKEESIEKACFLYDFFKKNDETFIFNDEDCPDGELINGIITGLSNNSQDSINLIGDLINKYINESTITETNFGYVNDYSFGKWVKIIIDSFMLKFYYSR